MEIYIKLQPTGKYALWINGGLISDNYSSAERAADKARKYAKGQNK